MHYDNVQKIFLPPQKLCNWLPFFELYMIIVYVSFLNKIMEVWQPQI